MSNYTLDAILEQYECGNSILGKHVSGSSYSDGGNFVIGFLTCIVDILIVSILRTNTQPADIWYIPIQTGLYHTLYEGLAFFLMRYGAGITAIRQSMTMGLIWGAITAVIYFFILFSLFDQTKISLHANDDTQDLKYKTAYSLYAFYSALIILFYLVAMVTPIEYINKRPAFYFYAKYNILVQLFYLFAVTLIFKKIYGSLCPSTIIILLLESIVQPVIIYITLQIDSQYWQGLYKNDANPVSEVWDHVGLDTASTIAENLDTFERSSIRVPIVHFGLLSFDNRFEFVAGGFSRVYFGTYRRNKVAYKILFAMELTSTDVTEFYQEAITLRRLQHENVVKCLGVCVMPPALTLILEACKYGSLFEFLYTQVKPNKIDFDITTSENESLFSEKHLFSKNDMPKQRLTNNSNRGSSQSQVRLVSWGLNPMEDASFSDDKMSSSILNNNSNLETERMSSAAKSPKNFDKPLAESLIMNPMQSTYNNRLDNSSTIALTEIDLEKTDRKVLSSSLNSNQYISNRLSMNDNNNSTTNNNNNKSTNYSSQNNKNSKRSFSFSIGLSGENNVATDRSSRTFESLQNLMNESVDYLMSRLSTSSENRDDSSKDKDNHSNSQSRRKEPLYSRAQYVSLEQRFRMMRDAASSIAFLHSKGFMHCDIKSLNFLVDENLRVKLADMGEARLISDKPKRNLPPIPARNWAPPEVLASNAKADSYTIKSDVYGLSLILSELILIDLPFGDLPERVTPKAWLQILVVENSRPDLSYVDIPEALKDIIELGWNSDPNRRPSAQEVLNVVKTCITK
eukprot:gene12169-16296_t